MDIMNELKSYYLATTKEPQKLKILLQAFDRIILPKLQDEMSDEEIYDFILVNFIYFPTVAEMIKVMKVPEVDHKAIAEVWWDRIMKEMARTGYMKSIAFEDKLVNDFIKNQGGWVEFCKKDYEELKWVKKEFITVYSGLKRTGCIGETKKLSGFEELTNQTITEEPALISLNDRREAKQLSEPIRLKTEEKRQGLIEDLSKKLTPFQEGK